MSWLRIDDRFTEHPKFAGWSPAERWDWLALLCYCARYRTQGVLPSDANLLPILHSSARTSQAVRLQMLLQKAVAAGLADDTPAGYRVHHWDDYNPTDPTAAERKRRQRARDANRDASVTERDEGRDEDRDIDRDENVTRARARARGPVPSPERDKSLSRDVTLNGDLSADVEEAERVQAWVDRSHAPDVRAPQAFLRSGVQSGEWPDGYVAPHEARPVNMPVTVEVCPDCGCSPPMHTDDCSLKP